MVPAAKSCVSCPSFASACFAPALACISVHVHMRNVHGRLVSPWTDEGRCWKQAAYEYRARGLPISMMFRASALDARRAGPAARRI
jgi:hypothetical protein